MQSASSSRLNRNFIRMAAVFFWVFILIKIFTIATEGYAYSLSSMFSHLYSEDIQNDFTLITSILAFVDKFELTIFIVCLLPFIYFLARTRAVWWAWVIGVIFILANVIEIMLIQQVGFQDVGTIPDLLMQLIGVQALGCLTAGLAVWLLLRYVKLHG